MVISGDFNGFPARHGGTPARSLDGLFHVYFMENPMENPHLEMDENWG